jgi:outer membrane protein OmpA-like peptidoglycan-associated protein
MTRITLIAGAAAVALAGCTDPAGSPDKTVGGGLLGAGAGAALGTLAGGDDRRNALIGAGIGLLAGGAVGAYLDRQEAALARDLEGTGAYVQDRGDRLAVIFPGNVTFDTDSARINPGFVRPLERVAQTLREYPKSFLDVIGHTDSTGAADYNQRLSEERAESVADFFRSRGIYPGRIATFGMGEEEPIATNESAEGRARNRRVELVIIPAES